MMMKMKSKRRSVKAMRKGKPNNLATTHHYIQVVLLSTDLRRGTSALSPSRRSLRSVGTNRPVVPTSRLSTIGSRAFPVAGRRPGMTCRMTQQNYWPHFVVSPRHTCSGSLFPDYLLDIN